MRILKALLYFSFLGLSLCLQDLDAKEVSKVAIIQAPDAAGAQDIIVGLEFKLAKDWHIYWKNPGEVGFSPKVTWTLPPGWKASEILFPAPERLPTKAGGIAYGYANQVIYPVVLTPPAVPIDFASTPRIQARVDYLVCDLQCIPKTSNLEVELRPTGSSPREVQKLLAIFRNLPQPAQDSQIQFAKQSETSLQIDFTNTPAILDVFAFSEKEKLKDLKISKVSNSRWTIEHPTKIPDMEVTAVWMTDGNRTGATRVWTTQTSGILNASLLWALLFAFLGGLILNLMPCVLPVIVLKTAGLIKLGTSGTPAIRRSLFFTTFGIWMSFIGLAGIILFLKDLGHEVGWGFHFQSTGFVAFMTLAILLFAFNLFGLFEFHFSSTAATKISNSKTQEHPFFQGVFATLLATPCSAPFLGTALTFAISQSNGILVLTFFFMGVGLSAPYLLLMLAPKTLRLLPRPGAWMGGLKRILGYSLLLAVVWLLYVLNQQTSTIIVLFIFMISLGIYISLRELKSYARWALVTGFVLAGVVTAQNSAVTGAKSQNVQIYNAELLEKKVASGGTYYVVVTADWCLTCKYNENLIMRTDWFKNLLSTNRTEEIIFDWTNRDDGTSRFLREYGRVGIPFSMLISKEKTVVFPELLSRKNVEALFENFFKAAN